MNYRYYTEVCSLCGIEHPKRDLNKIYISYGHVSIASPKKLCSICDDCLPRMSEIFEVELPDVAIGHMPRRNHCKKCYRDVYKDTLYCQDCGNKLFEEEGVQG